MEIIILIVEWLVIISVIGLIIGLQKRKTTFSSIFFCIIILSTVFITIEALNKYNNKEIPAIEVYRDNTTLQITYQDSIPIDSVVVYKNK